MSDKQKKRQREAVMRDDGHSFEGRREQGSEVREGEMEVKGAITRMRISFDKF